MAERGSPYPYSYAEAIENGEKDLWAESYRENMSCSLAVEKALENGVESSPAREIIGEYGFKRLRYVLALSARERGIELPEGSPLSIWLKDVHIPKKSANLSLVVRGEKDALLFFSGSVYREFLALGLYDNSFIREPREGESYEGKVLILKEDAMKESAWSPDNQFWLAKGGFGCYPDKMGRAVFAICLSDFENARWNRSDFYGIMDEKLLPAWAKERLKELKASEQKEAASPAMGGQSM